MVVDVIFAVTGVAQPVSRFVLYITGFRQTEPGGARQVVHDEVYEVLVLHPVPNLLARLARPLLVIAEDPTLFVPAHFHCVGRVHDSLAPNDLAEILTVVLHHPVLGPAQIQTVVFVRQLRVGARHLDRLYINSLALSEVLRRHARHVELVGGGEEQQQQVEDRHADRRASLHFTLPRPPPALDSPVSGMIQSAAARPARHAVTASPPHLCPTYYTPPATTVQDLPPAAKIRTSAVLDLFYSAISQENQVQEL